MARQFRLYLAALGLAYSLGAGAFPIAARPQAVVEFYNVHLGHYFLAMRESEIAAIEAGSAGPGWVRTGYAFRAYPHPIPVGSYCSGDCGTPVHRFYSATSNSHFYTAEGAELEMLRRQGGEWTFERVEFAVPLPDASGQCGPGLAPVHRLYNNRWMFSDSNHRFVFDLAQRDRMVAKGWVHEGVAFCAYGGSEIPLKSFTVAIDLGSKVRPSAECEDESVNLGPCMAVNNLPVPAALLGPIFGEATRPFFDWTGMSAPFNYVLPSASTPQAAASEIFVQGPFGFANNVLGIHVSSARRTRGDLASINPLYQLRSARDADGRDRRFFPFAPADEAVQIKVSYVANIKRIAIHSAGSHAYGHPTLEFLDARSGKNLYFTGATYGTGSPDQDLLIVDAGTGKVIVGTTLRENTPFLRNFGLPTLYTPPGFVSESFWGWGGYFEFRVDRHEFQRVLDAARTLDPALSADPADYLLDNFHFNNEVYRDAEIGMNLADYKLELIRR